MKIEKRREKREKKNTFCALKFVLFGTIQVYNERDPALGPDQPPSRGRDEGAEGMED
jgi:hypothetical protein